MHFASCRSRVRASDCRLSLVYCHVARNLSLVVYVRDALKAIRTAFTSQKSWKKELNKFLLNYRATPHSTTGFPPAKLLYNQDIHTKLPQVTTCNKSQTCMEVCKRDALAKERMKQHSDDKKRAKESNLKIGDTVLVQQPKRNKFITKYDSKPYKLRGRKEL